MTELQTLALIVETEPDPEDIRLIEKRLYEFNVQATGITDGKLGGSQCERRSARQRVPLVRLVAATGSIAMSIVLC
jgi:hypothetical protein